jgi:C4-dicarboxylate-specific signal transduction histidine kinase
VVIGDVSAQEPAHMSLLEADRIGLVGALSTGFAHEINNPLTSMMLNLGSLRKHLALRLPIAAQPQATRCLDDLTIGAERIAGNVRALRTLTTRSATAPVDLAAVVSAALRLATPTLGPRAHVIRQLFPVPRVVGEESRIGQAVLAMLLFSGSGFDADTTTSTNRITVSVGPRDGDVVVEVSDNGRDLTAEEARRAFDPFYRSSARGAGVGVGLGVARSVAAALGGEVTLVPRPGGGAVITMRLRATEV